MKDDIPEEDENYEEEEPIYDNPVEGSRETMPSSQRNTRGGSVLDSFEFETESQTHPAELLFRIKNLKDLVIKSDIPAEVVPLVSRMLWKAERYKVTALTKMVEWYLLTRLSTNRKAREEYLQAVVSTRKSDDDDDILNKLS